MNKEKEFEVRVYENRHNKQLSLIPIKKNLSPELLKILNDRNIAGLKLKVIKQLKTMPLPKTYTNEERRILDLERSRRYQLRLKGGKK